MPATSRGFTLVELLVALTLIGVGAAAWVSTSAVAIRIAGAADRAASAQGSARAAAERLAARECVAAGSGETHGTRWSVQALRNATRRIEAEHAYAAEAGTRLARATLVVSCR